MVVSQNNSPHGDEGFKEIFNQYVPFFFASSRSLFVCPPCSSHFLTFWLDTVDHQQPRSPIGASLDLQYSVVGSSLPLASVKVVDTFRLPIFQYTLGDVVVQSQSVLV